ncbi:septation protein A [Marichromatium purpuratum 984]|uniref:Inner membrane-spanning protein YciB n=1 Tax=Marichromatium purpuratum 984 TaxID=765910 RepID=W0DW47_MARPU|nr:inner membrane-spanning protein YciB [Marichromatium purpuratum]AHF02820.1 septation protein A [Marichromatium purpuratum 984]
MKLLIDFFPILLFFVAYKLAGIYVATTVAILAAALQLGWTWWRQRRVETMHLVTLGLLVVFGGMTLALRDPIFVMWKPTIVNWLFAAAFLASQLIGQRTLVERTMGHAVSVEPTVWRRLNLMWVVFFLVLGLTNLLVVYVASGFFAAHQALLAGSGLASVDLTSCAGQFQGELLALCTSAQASEEIWVNFKLFGMMGMTLVFVLLQAFYLARHIEDEPRPQEAD